MTPTVQQVRARQMLWVPTDIQITRPAQKGDVAGHGFHGNRYTGGIGGGEETPKAPAYHTVNLKPATRQSLVAELMLATMGGKEVSPQDYLMVCGKYALMQQDADNDKLDKEGTNRFYELQETMGEYETSAAWLMNMELRNGTDPSLLGLDSHTVDDIDAAFKEFGTAFEEDKTVYRGAIMEPPTAGEVYHDEAFLSTIPTPGEAVYASSDSYARTVAEHAAPVEGGASTVWEINIPAGQEVLGVRPDEVLTSNRSNDSGEPFMEIALNRGADLRVESVEKKAGGVYVVKATYLGSHPAKPDATPRDINKAAKTVPDGTAWRFLWMPGDMTITRPDAKGDASGHAFHGNRYTGGIGGEMPTLSNGHDPKLIAAINEATAKIKTLTHERAYVFAKDGKPIAIMEGGTSTVRATNRQVGEIATAALDGGIVGLHNHPGGQGTSFSPADVATGFKFGFSEIRVMADPWVYVMRPGKAATPSGGFDRGRGYMALDRAEELSSKEGLTWHEVWRQVAAEQDLEYFRVHTGDAARFLSPTAGEAAIAQHQAS